MKFILQLTAVPLAIVTLLMAQSLVNAQDMEPGFESRPVDETTTDSDFTFPELEAGETPQLEEEASVAVPTDGNTLPVYIGVGGNVGIRGNEPAISEGGIALVSKLGISDTFSVHHSTTFGDDIGSIFALTVDLPVRLKAMGDIQISPFIGGGAMLELDDGLQANPALMAGVDIPLSRDFTATSRVNVGFKDKTDVGLVFGVGYNFRGHGAE